MRAFAVAGFVLASVFGASAQGRQGGGQGVVRGVNLGGWLVTEPWLTPTLFNSTGTADEWHLCSALGKDKALQTLNQHWSTFYSRNDIVAIKAAGLTHIRIPLGYWAVDLLDYEPYVSGQYPYLIQAVQWAGEVGLSVFIDVHGVPGSQNGWEESGIVGPIDYPANSTNQQRTLNVLQNLTTEFSKSEYNGAVTNIEIVNEPIFDSKDLYALYTAGYKVISPANASGINVTIHDAFYNPSPWKNYDPVNTDAVEPAEFLTLDTHQFWAFAPFTDLNENQILDAICNFSVPQRQPNSHIPPTLVGEWSLSTGITANSSSNTEQDQAKRTWFRKLFEAQNAAFTPSGPNQASIGWLFWAWKTEYDIDAWSYQRGLSDEYIPKNVSDPSTYIFPIDNETGCIDYNFKYTAPATATFTTYGQTAGPTSASTATSGSSTASATSSADGSSSTKSSAAFALEPVHGLAAVPFLLFGML